MILTARHKIWVSFNLIARLEYCGIPTHPINPFPLFGRAKAGLLAEWDPKLNMFIGCRDTKQLLELPFIDQ